MFRDQLRAGVQHVGAALRDPEEFAAAWNEGRNVYPLTVWTALLATAVVGTTTYGMTMGLLGGADAIFYKAVICTLAAGIAWAMLERWSRGAGADAAGSARDGELGWSRDGRVDPGQLVFYGDGAASEVCAGRKSDCVYRRGHFHGGRISARNGAAGAEARVRARVVVDARGRDWSGVVLLLWVVPVCLMPT